jgi:DNA-binding MarR family transcriptional regulator
MSKYTDDCPAHLTSIAGALLEEGLSRKLKKSGYPVAKHHLRILFYVFEEDGIEQRCLLELVRRSKLSIVKGLNDLEKANIIVKIQSEGDLRSNRVYLTHLGKELKTTLLDLVDEHKREMFNNLSQEDMEAYLRVLRGIMKNSGE